MPPNFHQLDSHNQPPCCQLQNITRSKIQTRGSMCEREFNETGRGRMSECFPPSYQIALFQGSWLSKALWLFTVSNNLFQEQIFSHIYLWLSVSGVFDLPTKQHMPIAFGLWQQWRTWPWWGRLGRWGRSGRSSPKPERQHIVSRETLRRLVRHLDRDI